LEQIITKIQTPLTDDILKKLKVGMKVMIDGTIYLGRDVVHQRFVELINKGEELPIDIRGQIIFYTGPAPPKPGMIIGSIGPTTSYRMDGYTPTLLAHGLKGMIGKGRRSKEVIESMKSYKAVYFVAIGGVGAFFSERIKRAEVVAYEELGTEALRKIIVKEFPVIVANDIFGNDFYEVAGQQYRIA
jgi:fumarate hydratase subunit beta